MRGVRQAACRTEMAERKAAATSVWVSREVLLNVHLRERVGEGQGVTQGPGHQRMPKTSQVPVWRLRVVIWIPSTR